MIRGPVESFNPGASQRPFHQQGPSVPMGSPYHRRERGRAFRHRAHPPAQSAQSASSTFCRKGWEKRGDKNEENGTSFSLLNPNDSRKCFDIMIIMWIQTYGHGHAGQAGAASPLWPHQSDQDVVEPRPPRR